ncbi:hypothetical protein [Ciceribacter azotifigens]|uniref:hypothetical protein n=1 Tax=Ciceribacter azotifigens TaxID=2069303 RepID=UPI003A8A8C02
MTKAVVFSVAFLVASAGAAFANEPQDPVAALMAVADGIEGNSEASDYFDEVLLTSIYSESFAQVYRMAALGDQLLDMGGEMTGQDEVIVSQDPCEMKDLKIVPRPAKDKVTPVEVFFDVSSCWRHDPHLDRPSLLVHVISENGRYVIDNFWNGDYDGGRFETSVKAKFAALAKRYVDDMLTSRFSPE